MPIRKISTLLMDDITASFAHLATLSLAKNEISLIENLERLAPSLTKLDLSYNLIAPAPSGLESLMRLVHLDLSHNRLSSFAGLEHLGALEVLHANNNLIERADALRSLAYLARLHTLTLADNPLARGVAYRVDVARRLPALQLLDGNALHTGQRLMAERLLQEVASSSSSVAAASSVAPTAPAALPTIATKSPAAVAAPLASLDESALVSARLSQQREAHLKELTAAEHKLALERDRHSGVANEQRSAFEAESRAHALAHAAAMQAKDERIARLTHEHDELTHELHASEESSAAALDQCRRELEAERATSRQLRAYVAGIAARSAGGVNAVSGGVLATTTPASAEAYSLLAVGASPRVVEAGCQTVGEEGEEDEWLRSSLRAATTEKELLAMRLDAMSRLMELQEEALCAGMDGGDGGGGGFGAASPRSAVDVASDEEDAAPSPAGPMYAPMYASPMGGGGGGFGGVAANGGVGVNAHATAAMVRGWRVKMGETLLHAEHERLAHRRELEENLAALEASAAELARGKQSEKLLEAKLAVCVAERAAERVNGTAALEEAASARQQLAACEEDLATERAAARALVSGVTALHEAQQAAEGRLQTMGDALRPIEDRLGFALGRTRYLAQLQAAKAAHDVQPPAVSPALHAAVDGVTVAAGGEAAEDGAVVATADVVESFIESDSGGISHLRAEVARLSAERSSLLQALAEKEAACSARLVATDELWEARVHEARAVAGKWQAELNEENESADALRAANAELSARCDELQAHCDGLRAAVKAAEEAKATHARLLAEVQSQAVEQRVRHEAERAADRHAAQAGITDALEAAERERLAAASAAEAAASAAAALEQTEERLRLEAAAAISAAETTATEARAAFIERERTLEREAAGLRREATKESVARKSLEREVSRLKSQDEAATGAKYEYLEKQLEQRDAMVGGLRKERNALLAALRQQQQQQHEPSQQEPSPPRGQMLARPKSSGAHGSSEEEEEDVCEAAVVATTPFRTPVERSARPKERDGERSTAEPAPHARRRVLSEGLLDELQALSQQAEELLAAPSPLAGA